MLSVVRQKRLASGLGSMTKFASAIGVSASHYSHFELGYEHTLLHPEQVDKLAEMLKCDPSELVDEDGHAVMVTV